MRINLIRVLIVAVLIFAFSLPTWSPARADDMTCPEHMPVSIDIKPGSSTNPIKLSSQGIIPVAVLTTAAFDASQFIPDMAHMGDANTPMSDLCMSATAVRWAYQDVNGDGFRDLVFFFNTQDLNLTLSSPAATLMAHGAYGATTLHIIGTDVVLVKP